MAKTLEEYLDDVDYDFKDYIPSKEAVKFVNFIKLVNGGEEANKTPVVHFKVLDNVFSKKKRHAIVCHRGFAKTTLMAEYLFMYIAVFGSMPNFGEVSLALYVADSAEGGAKNLRKNIEFRYNQSDFMQEYVPKVRFTDNRLEFTNKSGKTFIVKMYGAKTNIRGTKEMGIRPQLVVMDDLLSDQDAKSKTELENVKNNVHNAIAKALDPRRSKTIYVGTPFNKNDPLVEVVESGKWDVSVYPLCEKFPCSREEFKGSWEDRFPYEYVEDEYESARAVGRIHSFNQELMLRIISEEDMIIDQNDIIFYDRTKLLKNKSKYLFYITTDFATSEKSSSDYSVLSVWAVDANKNFFLVDTIIERQLMDKNIEDLFMLVRKYKPQKVGIEITGQQGGFIAWIQDRMLETGTFFDIATEKGKTTLGIRPTADKFRRFMDVVPLFKSKKIWIPKQFKDNNYYKEIFDELNNVSVDGFKSKHDDFLDTISMLMLMDIIYPNVDVEYRYDDAKDEFIPVDEYEIDDFGSSYDFD